MFPEQPNADNFSPRAQRGSMLLIGVFIILVMSALGLAVAQLLADSGKTVTYEVFGARAFNAANSGAEKMLSELFPVNSAEEIGDSDGDGVLNCPADFVLNVTNQSGFEGCTADVKCTPFLVTQTASTHFRIESTGECQGGEYIVQRSVAVEARRSNP